MTKQLFKKAIVFTDIHFGLKSNSVRHNKDCLEFIEWMVGQAKEAGCETCLFLGDYNHHRASINLLTMQYGLKGLELLSQNFENTYFIPGNHDLYYREKRDIHGVEWAKHLPNIHIVNDTFVQDDVAIIPWLVGDDYKQIKKIKAKYMFGHFELPHFKMNALVEMPDTGTVNSTQMAGVEKVFSGHFHWRQTKGNITYMGNAFPHNFTDVGDDQRGAMLLEWDGEPEYRAWPDQPLYIATTLQNLIDNHDTLLRPRMNVKVTIDINISYEEANFIKETFQKQYELREISLIPAKDGEHENELNDEDVSFNSVDAIIAEQLNTIESDFYKPALLMEIYNNL